MRNRLTVVCLAVFAIALSVALILTVERIKDSARDSFTNSVSGVDMIVAPRGNDVQILMSTVFGLGSAGPGLDWDTFEMVRNLPTTGWAVPLLMGDTHQGFPVFGTTPAYFDHFKHSGGKDLNFASGGAFEGASDTVVGSEVAKRFGYKIGDSIVNAHGAGRVAIKLHDSTPFRVVGVLSPTGTALDRSVYVSLGGFNMMHADAKGKTLDPLAPDSTASSDGATQGQSERINAIFVGLKNRATVLSAQRFISQWPEEPLSAVLPQLALLQLWQVTNLAERALQAMAGAVALAGFISMSMMLMASLEGRRREFAILRAVGASPVQVLGLIVFEAVSITLVGILIGLFLALGIAWPASPLLSIRFGVALQPDLFGLAEIRLLATVFAFGLLAGLWPAIRVYRLTLTDGLTVTK